MKKKTKFINIAEFTELSKYLNLTKFCKLADLSYSKIWSKVKFQREFDVMESKAVGKGLLAYVKQNEKANEVILHFLHNEKI
jgi:hypothetical protein